jgi:hypothetical protein
LCANEDSGPQFDIRSIGRGDLGLDDQFACLPGAKMDDRPVRLSRRQGVDLLFERLGNGVPQPIREFERNHQVPYDLRTVVRQSDLKITRLIDSG